jgi:hypothetical protein
MDKERMHPTHQRPPMGQPLAEPSAETLAARDEEDRAAYHEAQRRGRFDDGLAAELAQPVSETPPPRLRVWTCWIGETDQSNIPEGGDAPMRDAVAAAYYALTGRDDDFIFSGWGSTLPESYRAVVENREPDIEAQLAELRPLYEMLVDEAQRQGKLSDPIARIDWIRRHVGQGAPESWQINDFVSLAVVKLGDAVMQLNERKRGRGLRHADRDQGRENLLAAISVLLDCWERYGA